MVISYFERYQVLCSQRGESSRYEVCKHVVVSRASLEAKSRGQSIKGCEDREGSRDSGQHLPEDQFVIPSRARTTTTCTSFGYFRALSHLLSRWAG